jgi:DNA phosphorothioation-associated putative methyltransferase
MSPPSDVGKRVHGALYLHRDSAALLDDQARETLTAAKRLAGEPGWNVVKLEPARPHRVTLLLYEDFAVAAFPALLASTTVDLARDRVSRRDFRKSVNPPILHRKELLLAADHADRPRFAALTAALEDRGLFADSARIGFWRDWQDRLAAAGIAVTDHTLSASGAAPPRPMSATSAAVERHRTAIVRDRLSAPMDALVRYGLLSPERTVLDYGCGQGDDVRALRAAGFAAVGWDPHYAPDAPLAPADCVNLGYVLNVIEDPAERRIALRHAFELANNCLAVAVMVEGKADTTGHQPYRDGFLTRRGTFQKYFRQDEARTLIESELGREAITVGAGLFLVFRDELLEQSFLLERQRRRPVLAIALRPPPRERPLRGQRRAELLRPLLERLWTRTLELARRPEPDELDAALLEAIRREAGGLARAERLCRELFDPAALAAAAATRREDLLVYFALNLFHGRTRYRALPLELQRDVRAIFGSHGRAVERPRAVLFSAGSAEAVTAACAQASDVGLGWLDAKGGLILATALVECLPAILRCYVGCAGKLYGDVAAADLVKIHARSGKLTLLRYDSFADSPLPRLRERIKIDLRRQRIDSFEYGGDEQLLLMKSRYLAPELPGYAEQNRFDAALSRLHLVDPDGFGPSALELDAALQRAGYQVVGFEVTQRIES